MRTEILQSISREQAIAVNGMVNSDTPNTLSNVAEALTALSYLCHAADAPLEGYLAYDPPEGALRGASLLLDVCASVLQWEQENA